MTTPVNASTGPRTNAATASVSFWPWVPKNPAPGIRHPARGRAGGYPVGPYSPGSRFQVTMPGSNFLRENHHGKNNTMRDSFSR